LLTFIIAKGSTKRFGLQFGVGSSTTHSSCYRYNNGPYVSGCKAGHIGVIHSVSLLRELMDYSNYFSHLCFGSVPRCPILMLINGVLENCKWCMLVEIAGKRIQLLQALVLRLG